MHDFFLKLSSEISNKVWSCDGKPLAPYAYCLEHDNMISKCLLRNVCPGARVMASLRNLLAAQEWGFDVGT